MLVTSKNKDKIKSVQQVIRAGVELLAKEIESGHPEVLTECLRAMARFHTYSFGNVLLVATQCPAATQVAGWRAWNELGRRVKQGEKGILIFAPILSQPKKVKTKPTEKEKSNYNTANPQQLLGFRPVRVFDVAQTEGTEVSRSNSFPKLELDEALTKLVEFAATQALTIEYSEKIAPARGISYRGVIRLLPDMEPDETISVLVRELAVQMLYETQRRSVVTRNVLLTEAKAVAFVVGNALGLENKPAENFQLYHGDLNLLAESLEVVKRTAAVILGALSPRDAVANATNMPGAIIANAQQSAVQEGR